MSVMCVCLAICPAHPSADGPGPAPRLTPVPRPLFVILSQTGFMQLPESRLSRTKDRPFTLSGPMAMALRLVSSHPCNLYNYYLYCIKTLMLIE